jgi:hypothetical protein
MDEPHPYTDLPLIVVTGVGRSGTTALRKALGCHPDIISTDHEHNVVFDILGVAHKDRTEYSRRYAAQVSDSEHDALFRELVLGLIFPVCKPDTQNKSVLLFTNLCPRTGDYLLEAFQRAQVVCLVRNGIETVHSRTKHAAFGLQSFKRHCQIWNNAGVMERWSKTNSRSMLVRHENLKQDANEAIESIIDFCNLTGSAAPAQHINNSTHHPTQTDGQAGWQSWTADQRQIFERLCSDEMTSLGYQIPWLAHSKSHVG